MGRPTQSQRLVHRQSQSQSQHPLYGGVRGRDGTATVECAHRAGECCSFPLSPGIVMTQRETSHQHQTSTRPEGWSANSLDGSVGCGARPLLSYYSTNQEDNSSSVVEGLHSPCPGLWSGAPRTAAWARQAPSTVPSIHSTTTPRHHEAPSAPMHRALRVLSTSETPRSSSTRYACQDVQQLRAAMVAGRPRVFGSCGRCEHYGQASAPSVSRRHG